MKTLAVYHKQLGDTLLLQPAIAKLADQDGGPVGLVTRPEFTDMVSLMPGAVPLPWRQAPRVERLFCYDAGDRSSFTSLWCRARHKTLTTFSGFYRRFYHPWIFDEINLQDQGQVYRARYFWDVTPGVTSEFQPPILRMPPRDWNHPELPGEPFVLVHATSAWQRKCWPEEPWRKLLGFLCSSAGMSVVLTGGTSEWERGLCARITEGVPDVLNLGGRTSIRQLMAVASRAAFVMTVDGFMSHLALAFRKPCVTLFGPTNANHWHLTTPWSEALYAGDNPAAKNKSLEALSADIVIECAARWLVKLRQAPIPQRLEPTVGN